MTNEEYKQLSMKEFTKAAGVPTRGLITECCRNAGLKIEKFEIRKGMRIHCVIRR